MPRRSINYKGNDKEQIQQDICARIAEGEKLTSLCKELKINRGTIYEWLNEKDSEFSNMYIKAQYMRGDKYNDDIEDFVEQCKKGIIEPSVANVCIQTRKWQAAKFYPKMFGDRTQIEHSGKVDNNNPLLERLSKLSDNEILNIINKK